MRLSLIPLAEKYATLLIEQSGIDVEYQSIAEGAEEFFYDEPSLLEHPRGEELDEFLEYVDHLIRLAEVKVKFPKTRL